MSKRNGRKAHVNGMSGRNAHGDKPTTQPIKREVIVYPPMRKECDKRNLRGSLNTRALDPYYRPSREYVMHAETETCGAPELRMTPNHRIPSVAVTQRPITGTWKQWQSDYATRLDRTKHAKALQRRKSKTDRMNGA